MNILSKNLLILASAGSGKTHQLGNRVIGLVAGGVAPEKIVALTFTRKAAGEFADSVVTKLAKAATDPVAAGRLRDDIGITSVDFGEALERVVKALPRLPFGTMDSFFARVVRGFQYELGLTGGKFDLLEGPRADAARDALIAEILADTLDQEGGAEFFHAFRRANQGREDLRIQEPLREFLRIWHGRYRASQELEWGPAGLAETTFEEWEIQKHELIDRAEAALDSLTFTDGRQCAALGEALDYFRSHTIGSGTIGGGNGMTAKLLEAALGDVPLELSYYKALSIDGPCGKALHEMIRFAARCEFAAALARTRAIRDVVTAYDRICETRLRRNGLLGFDDVKELMGAWAKSEPARLRREAVDFRLDARYDHWLLDEFQDTSRPDWNGLSPLVDEAAGEGEGTMFVVGDRKQAIYGWRGGDVALFDEIIGRYGDELAIEPMAESWRSCPEVLELVNRVCGDLTTMARLFGREPVARWQWQDHVSAPHLKNTMGEARVERLEESWEERLVPLLEELGIGERELTCGVLVRNNTDVRSVADHLRANGFDVVEEGRRQPAKDGPVGIALANLLVWLAEPSNRFARETVAMSPLPPVLREKHGESWLDIWSSLLDRASRVGFAMMIAEVVEPLRSGWSDFGKQRAADIIAALASLDASGAVTIREAADWIERLEVAQSPGAAAVQVMTIHKSKGLGFDVVVVPDVPAEQVPQTQHFEIAEGPGWLTGVPPSWARNLLPEISAAEEAWRARQRYEGFCMLYVAMTRAKRGLYIFLSPLPKKPDLDRPSLSNWLAASVSAGIAPGIVYQSGSSAWVNSVPAIAPEAAKDQTAALVPPETRRERFSPSKSENGPAFHSSAGLNYGREIHEAFESVGWLDDADETIPPALGKLLAAPAIAAFFERRGRDVELFREQPVEAIVDGNWLSGAIDRLHVFRRPEGSVERVELIDFKTDAIANGSDLLKRHSAQMNSYRDVVSRAFPAAVVCCYLLSTHCREIVEVEPANPR